MLTTFDTKEAFKAFSGHGFSEEQAEVLTDFLQKLHVTSTGNLVTKNDLKLTEASLRTEINNENSSLRAEMSSLKADLNSFRKEVASDMKMLEQRMTIKLGGLLVIGIGIMTAIQQLLG